MEQGSAGRAVRSAQVVYWPDPAPGRTPIVLVSPGGHLEIDERLRRAGVVVCLTRPVRPTRLFAALARGLQAAPAREEPVVTATPGTRSDAVTPCRPLRILVAEDNRVNQVVIVRMLEKAGHRVSLAANGREAVDAVAREAYDLVMMDCQMPELDGFEAPVTADRLVAALARWGAASG